MPSSYDLVPKFGDPLIKSMNETNMQKTIHKYLAKKNKDQAEVFTPVILIEELLNQIPRSVWSNPRLRWLDPANGIGNFPMVVYFRLMKGLKSKILNEKTRSNHILSNMLYMVEINRQNVMISKRIFGKDANISCADFINQEKKWIKDFRDIEEFDIIMGNPPFQKPVKNTRKGNTSIWELFVEKSLSHLAKNGFLSARQNG